MTIPVAIEGRGLFPKLWQDAFGKRSQYADHEPWSGPILMAIVLGFLVTGLSLPKGAVAIGLLAAGAAMVTGSVVGFLFGIPRSAQDQAASEQLGVAAEYKVNTNLEQISDWLTKIIVGIGLTQLGAIPAKFMTVAEYVSKGIGGASVMPPSAVAVGLVYFGIVGFLGTYLWTRLLLMGEFSRADRAARQSPEFLEGLVEALLYQPAPKGFTAAIQNGLLYNQRYGETNWRIWRSLACAYGQQFGFLRNGTEAERQVVRDKALAAVKAALDLNPDECRGMRAMWDPAIASPQENDLLVFKDDAGFAEVFAKCP